MIDKTNGKIFENWTSDELNDLLVIIDYGWYEATNTNRVQNVRVVERDKAAAKLRTLVSGELVHRAVERQLKQAKEAAP